MMDLNSTASVFSLAMFLTTIAIIEIRNLKYTAYAYVCQAVLLCGFYLVLALQVNPRFYYWLTEAFAAKVILIPLLFFLYIRKNPAQGARPMLGYIPSVAIAGFIVLVLYSLVQANIGFIAPGLDQTQGASGNLLAVSITLLGLGLYGLLTRRDAVKMVFGLCIIDNGAHLCLVSLALSLPETAVIGITTDSVIAIILLLFIIRGVRKEFGSTDAGRLNNLRW